jgi:hypothetical protein
VIVIFATADPSSYTSTLNMCAFLILLLAAEYSQLLSCKVAPVLYLQYVHMLIVLLYKSKRCV